MKFQSPPYLVCAAMSVLEMFASPSGLCPLWNTVITKTCLIMYGLCANKALKEANNLKLIIMPMCVLNGIFAHVSLYKQI